MSGLEIDVRDLVRHPGASRQVRVDEPLGGLDTELAHVPPDRAVEADLLFEGVVEGVLVSGPVTGTMRVECARCLRPVEMPFEISVQELFVTGARPEDDEYPLVEGAVHLEQMIRDAVVMAMPFAPLCRPECMGLCPRCGGDRNLGECRCGPEMDERWAALSNLNLPPFQED
jgi:uncharacterized protein